MIYEIAVHSFFFLSGGLLHGSYKNLLGLSETGIFGTPKNEMIESVECLILPMKHFCRGSKLSCSTNNGHLPSSYGNSKHRNMLETVRDIQRLVAGGAKYGLLSCFPSPKWNHSPSCLIFRGRNHEQVLVDGDD